MSTDAFADFLRVRDDADPHVAPALRSALLIGNSDRLILLLHGLTAAPAAWTPVARALHRRGESVAVVRLPQHGHADRMTTALTALSAAGLCADLRDVLTAAARTGKHLVVVGHSLGGTLALYAGAVSEGVERVVAVAPFLGIASIPSAVHPPLLSLLERVGSRYLWWDPILRDAQGNADGYPRYPIGALVAGMRIADEVERVARRGEVRTAADFVLNERETSVNNAAALRLARRWQRAGARTTVARLAGLPPSHDIIDARMHGADRVRPTLVEIIAAGSADIVHAV